MLDAFKMMTFLRKNKLSIEEFWMMYKILVQKPGQTRGILKVLNKSSDKALEEFSRMSREYDNVATLGKHPIDWVAIAVNLEQRGFVQIWARKDDSIKMVDIELTEQFIKLFAISDVEQAFKEFYEMYPKVVQIKSQGAWYPSMDYEWSKMVQLYADIILKGNSLEAHNRCLAITEMYLADQDRNTAPSKMEKYFNSFEAIATIYEEGSTKEMEDMDNGEDY